MTSSEIQLFQLFRPHIMTVSGVPECILYGQSEDSPPGEYAVIQPKYSIGERGQANIKKSNLIDDRVATDIKAQTVMTMVVEFYRGEAHDYAQRLLQIGRRQDVTWELFKSGISIRNTGPVMDLTALQAVRYERRARIELFLLLESSSEYAVNNILGTSVVTQNENGDVLREIPIDIRG